MHKKPETQAQIDRYTNMRKITVGHSIMLDIIDHEIEKVRERYESTSPASEFLRGQLASLKDLRSKLGDK